MSIKRSTKFEKKTRKERTKI